MNIPFLQCIEELPNVSDCPLCRSLLCTVIVPLTLHAMGNLSVLIELGRSSFHGQPQYLINSRLALSRSGHGLGGASGLCLGWPSQRRATTQRSINRVLHLQASSTVVSRLGFRSEERIRVYGSLQFFLDKMQGRQPENWSAPAQRMGTGNLRHTKQGHQLKNCCSGSGSSAAYAVSGGWVHLLS